MYRIFEVLKISLPTAISCHLVLGTVRGAMWERMIGNVLQGHRMGDTGAGVSVILK